MTIDLAPFAGASRTSSSSALRGARRVLAVGHENPDADTLGATLGVVALVEALGGDRRPGVHRSAAAAVRLRDRHRPVPDRPGSRGAATTCSSSPTAARSTASARSATGIRDLFERLPRVVIDHHASNDVDRRGRLDRAGRRRDVRDGRPARRCASASASTPATGRAIAAGADGRHRHGHRDLRPSQRHAADPGRVGRPGRGRRAAVRHLASAVPLQAGGPAAPVRAGAGSPGERATTAGSCGRRCSTPTSPRPGPSRRSRRGSSTCSPRPRRPRSPSCSRKPGRRPGSASGPSRAAWMRPS